MTPKELRQIETTRQRLVDGVTAGCVATLIMTTLVLVAPALGGGRLPLRAAEALLSLREHPVYASLALAVHLLYGSLAGGLFAASARRITVGRGVLFGLGLWGVAVAVYAPLVGLGFVTSREPALAALAIPAHLLYGTALGALAPRGEIVQPIEDRTADRAPALDELETA
jgi:hypothetical protein